MSHEDAKRVFMKMYDQYSDAIFRFCMSRTGDRESAYDFTQETFMKTWNYISQEGILTQPKSFLYRVAYNIIVDHSRKMKEQCPKCGFRNAVRSKFCNQCGAGLPCASSVFASGPDNDPRRRRP